MSNRDYKIEDLEKLLDNIPYEVFIKDDEGRYKYVNKYFYKKKGYSKEKIIGKTDLEIELENKVTIIEEKTENISIKNIVNFTEESWDKNYNKYYRKILVDLKEKIKADDIALYLYDEHTNNMTLYFHDGTKKEMFNNKYGFEVFKQFLLNLELPKIIESHDKKEIYYLYPIRVKYKLYGMIKIYYKDNSKFYINNYTIEEAFTLLGIILENKNISKHLKTELIKKEDIEKRLEMVIDTVIDIYALIKNKNDTYHWVDLNRKCMEIIQWKYEDLVDKSPLELIHEDDREELKCIIKNHKIYRNFVCRILCKSGNYKILSLNWSNISNGNIIVTGKDITEERELLKDKESLQQAVEVESLKTEFFANLSHEFKTPLNIILSSVQVILSYIQNNPKSLSLDKLFKYLKGIEQNSYRLLKLANNMIDITKIDSGFYEIEMGNYNIVEVIENIVQSVAEYMNNNKRKITFDTVEEDIIIACDPDKIERIILNLLSNSMKFTSVNGKIYVDIDVTEDLKNVIIKVKNNGPAISPDDSQKIFERFTQSENLLTRSVEGSGIGLALVKSLVELHNGRIYVNTYIDNGTEFCIELPIRKIMNSSTSNVLDKNLNSKVQKYTIEFSDIYTLNQ